MIPSTVPPATQPPAFPGVTLSPTFPLRQPFANHSDSDSGFESPPGSPRVSEKLSRRVIITGLPRNTTEAQLLQVVRGRGGLVSAATYTGRTGGATASLDFVHADSAESYVKFIKHNHFSMNDADGNKYDLEAFVLESCTSTYSCIDRVLLRDGFTRALRLAQFPIKAVWFCLNALGLQYIVSARYDTKISILIIEFVSIFYAARGQRVLREMGMPYYKANFTSSISDVPRITVQWDSTDADVRVLHWENRTVPFIPKDHLSRQFNQLPYNQSWPDQWLSIMRLHGLDPLPRFDAMLDKIKNYACFSRNTWSWDIPAPAKHNHEAILETLHDEEWDDAWTDYFANNVQKTDDLRSLDYYGRVAQHRREKAIEQGLPLGAVPKCDGCEFGCGAMRGGPLPKVVSQYLQGEIETGYLEEFAWEIPSPSTGILIEL